MARTLNEIQSAIKVEIRTYPSLDNFLFPEDGGSRVSVFNTIIFVIAAAMFTLEVIVDALKIDIQEIADRAAPGNESWLRQQMLNFQFGDVIQINTTDPTADDYFVPTYDPIDESARIVTQCAVTDGINGSVNIKVAKDDGVGGLTALSGAELTALEDYYYGSGGTQGIGFAGVVANFISLEADRLYVAADVYFFGQYVEATVKANVITAIDSFLASFTDDNFNGNVFIIKLVDAIQGVEGVSRVKITDVKGRPNTTLFASASTVDVQGVYQTSAGYIVSEDTLTFTLNDSLTMIEETL